MAQTSSLVVDMCRCSRVSDISAAAVQSVNVQLCADVAVAHRQRCAERYQQQFSLFSSFTLATFPLLCDLLRHCPLVHARTDGSPAACPVAFPAWERLENLFAAVGAGRCLLG